MYLNTWRWLLIIWLSNASKTAAQSQIEFQIAPSNSTIARGSPVTFYCQVATSSSISLSWRHNGITVMPNNRTQQSVLPNGTLQLTVDPTMDRDDGNYSCVATVRSTQEEHIRTAYLQFALLPAPPIFLTIPSSIILPAAGEEVTFGCSFTGSPIPSITWLHNNNAISNSDFITVITQEQMVNTMLTIASVQQSDTGNYQCRAENDGGSITSDPALLQIASISHEFQLQPPPYILAVLNTTTIIPCGPPISTPPATVEWSKNFGQLIGSRFIVDGSYLTVLDTQLSDNGIYHCTALNPLTNQAVVSQGANVSVKVTPQLTIEPINRTVAVNGMIIFSCEASGDPNPTIMWYRNQILISGMDSRFQVVGGDLIIDPVMLSDDGSFTCEASNIVGNIQATVYLNVEFNNDDSKMNAVTVTEAGVGGTGAVIIFAVIITAIAFCILYLRNRG